MRWTYDASPKRHIQAWMDPVFVKSATVDSFVDGIQGWEVQSLVRMCSCKNINAALAYAVEVVAVCM